jgi:DNA (cytosine-5)-methyltransferase 1
MRRPRLLDLFCGAGGCSVGYERAGFDVVGVDIEPQPNYPFEFRSLDALALLTKWSRGARGFAIGPGLSEPIGRFDAIHASPPCQMYSRNMKHLSGPQPMLIEPIRELLVATGLPWVIENVEGSPLPDTDDLFGRHGIILCGTSFGMKIWRHRWFETSFPVTERPACNHSQPAMNPHNVAGRARIYAEHGRQDPEILWRNEMGVEWMGRYEAPEAIPPAYTEFIGRHLLAYLEVAA